MTDIAARRASPAKGWSFPGTRHGRLTADRKHCERVLHGTSRVIDYRPPSVLVNRQSSSRLRQSGRESAAEPETAQDRQIDCCSDHRSNNCTRDSGSSGQNNLWNNGLSSSDSDLCHHPPNLYPNGEASSADGNRAGYSDHCRSDSPPDSRPNCGTRDLLHDQEDCRQNRSARCGRCRLPGSGSDDLLDDCTDYLAGYPPGRGGGEALRTLKSTAITR